MIASEAQTILLDRLRDPQQTAYSQASVFSALTQAQRMCNAKFLFVLQQDTLTTAPRRCVYDTTALLPNSIKVQWVTEDGRDLVRANDWRMLPQIDKRWFRRLGQRFELWSLFGRDRLLVWPARDVPAPVTVVSSRLLPAVTLPTQVLEIRNEDMPVVLKVTEYILLTRGRLLRNLEAAKAELTGMLGLEQRDTLKQVAV